MGGGPGNAKPGPPQLKTVEACPSASESYKQRTWRLLKYGRNLTGASLFNLFNLSNFPWLSSTTVDKNVQLSLAELESLKSEIFDLEDRESHLKAQMEHLDELLRCARLASYLLTRTRWAALPGEPPVDENDIDDWLPHFVVLHGSCIFFYLHSADLSPQESVLLSDIVEVGELPSFSQDLQTRYSCYFLTQFGQRFECSSSSKVQVNSWFTALQAGLISGSAATCINSDVLDVGIK